MQQDGAVRCCSVMAPGMFLTVLAGKHMTQALSSGQAADLASRNHVYTMRYCVCN